NPRALLNKDFSASVWVKAKRKGIQIRVRMVLPRVPNPQKASEAFSTYLDGDIYENIDNWQRLEFHDLPKLLKDKQQLLRVELNRDVDMSDAFVDQLIVNLYTGPGRNQIWLDEVEIGPVTEDRPQRTEQSPGSSGPAKQPGAPGRAAIV